MNKKISLLGLIFLVSILLLGCTPNDLNKALEDVEQNTLSYLNPETEHQLLIPEEKQKALMDDYLSHYFSPWENMDKTTYDKKIEVIKETQYKLLDGFKKNPGWGQNHQPHPISWIISIEKNMDLGTFSPHSKKVITIENTNLRLLPTRRPSFSNLKEAGQGYPFDNFQTSLIPANLPALIIHTTKDNAWSLILTHNAFGWVPSHNLALVNDSFIQQWKTGRYVTPSVLETPLKGKNGLFYFYLRLGQIYPALQKEKDAYVILIAQKDLNNRAVIKTTSVEEKLMYEVPLTLTPYHIGLLANEMIGQPYGWGGLFGYRDCSSTMADLFAPFGIWLPRNSADQLNTWKNISLENLKNAEKLKLIEKKGVPMLTMLGWPGHIMLYLGTHNNQIYTFHTAWGLHTTSFLSNKTGRAILGKTVITPIDIGSEYLNIKATLLDKINTMTFLGEKEPVMPAKAGIQ